MKNKIQKIKGGYTLIETLFYITLFLIFTLAVINSLITMSKAFKEIMIQADLVQFSTVMERISREIRQAYGINSISASSLEVSTKDELGNNKTVKFLLSGSDVQLLENSVLTGNLNTPNTQITTLSFTEITTLAGKAVKIVISVNSARDSTGRVENFYETITLRGDYGS
ncbi:hypothetical protein A2814_02235 [Candidatus Nomurabacteria bacterium RIFCSPHIGHO2_01_FULL_38_19]|uniref:Prepilin-type N-terminal cleavage/methylation domain-containing protein n=1 Tax=Candidatus Nomurabacteria bacterium RIFCSPHIGHO2_01_FULL_38_19 TaxID=1801732 RepID=A0A1F6UUM1_9BACT|nr:MAG: hypothetical protein A2814_02235 [Candidatus Nomurabacteria bacterium RIFCSPHIGHO2_01_FULL_38_19]